jgi:hypothetical protein
MSPDGSILQSARSHPSLANTFLLADMAQDRLGRAPKLYSTLKWMLRILAFTRIGRSRRKVM